MNEPAVRVVKVGGSLLDFAGLPRAWSDWLAGQTPAVNVLIAGGGRWADVVRDADRMWGLGDETAHWLAIDVLAVSSRLLAAILPDARLEQDWERLRQLMKGREANSPLVFSPVAFLQQLEARFPPHPLPHDWHVTTDSIAARIATLLDADELVLLKSADPPPLLQPPYVDEYFTRASGGLKQVRFVNLRGFA